jgi:hypothetical protein
MSDLTSLEYQQLIITIIDLSYRPFSLLYVVIWAWAILTRLFSVL